MKSLLTAVLFLSVPARAASPREARLREFARLLGGALDISPARGRVHVSIVDLQDIQRPVSAGIDDEGPDLAASVIKLAVMAEAFHAEAEGRLRFSDKVAIKPCNVVGTMTFPPETEPLRAILNKPVAGGAEWSVGDLVQVMIQRSDNSATNTLIDVLGRERITSFVRGLGLDSTLVAGKLRGSDADTVCDDSPGANAMPPRDAAALLSLIGRRKLVGFKASARMQGLLGGQQDRGFIAAAVEKNGAEYFGKTGWLSDARNDAAIIEGPDRHYALVVYVHPLAEPADQVIQAVAEAVDKFFEQEER